MWNSSEEPSKSIPHQAPSLNHSLLWVFAALGPVGQLICGLRGLCRRKRTPVSITSTPTTCIVFNRCLRPRDAPAITYRSRPVSTFRRARITGLDHGYTFPSALHRWVREDGDTSRY